MVDEVEIIGNKIVLIDMDVFFLQTEIELGEN